MTAALTYHGNREKAPFVLKTQTDKQKLKALKNHNLYARYLPTSVSKVHGLGRTAGLQAHQGLRCEQTNPRSPYFDHGIYCKLQTQHERSNDKT